MHKILAKRVLPLLLAVAMMVTSIPQTAFAAGTDVTTEQSDVMENDNEAVEVENIDETDELEEITEELTVADVASATLNTRIEINTSYSTTATYSDLVSNPFGTASGQIESNVKVFVDGDEKDYLKDKVAFRWQKKDPDGSYGDMAQGTVPVDAGEYRYIASIEKIDNACNAAESNPVEFKINQEKIKISGIKDTVAPGTLVSDFIEQAGKDVVCSIGANARDFSAFGTAEIAVMDLSGTAIAGAERFENGKDYTYSVSVTLNESAQLNYTVVDNGTAKKLTVGNLFESKVDIKYVGGLETSCSKIYDGKAVDIATVVTPNVETKVTYTDNGKEVVVTDDNATYDKLTKTWLNADKEEIEAPKDAGVYYLRLTYEGKQGIISDSANDIKVEIKPASITIVPSLNASAKFYTGMKEADVLEKIGYKVVTADGKDFNISNEFWGVSYSDSMRSQPYAPVFKLQMISVDGEGKERKDESGNPVWIDAVADPSISKGLDSDRKYRVVFAGKKAIYNASGVKYTERDINEQSTNAAETNYIVNVDAKTIAENFVNIDVISAIKTEINVSALLNGENGSSFEKPNKVIFKESGLFNQRALYKKAVVNGSDNKQVAKDTDAHITYTWQYLNDVVTKINEDGSEIKEPIWSNYGYNWHSPYSPIEVGTYRLHVEYKDPTYVYAPSEAEVIFEIVPQLFTIVPEGSYEVYTHTYPSELISRINSDIKYKMFLLKDNEEGSIGKEKIFLNDYNNRNAYALDWFVERAVKDDNGNDTDQYERFTGEFESGYKYRLSVKLDDYSFYTHTEPYEFNSLSYPHNGTKVNSYVDYKEVEDVDGNIEKVYLNKSIELTVKEMGDTELIFSLKKDNLPYYKVYDGTPIDVDISELVAVSKKDGTPVELSEIPEEDIFFSYYYTYDDETVSSSAMVNAATYNWLQVVFRGNDKYYKNTTDLTETIAIIDQRELTVTPDVTVDMVAGEPINGVMPALKQNARFEGVADADKAAFTWSEHELYDYYSGENRIIEGFHAYIDSGSTSMPIQLKFYTSIYSADTNSTASGIYSGSKSYYVKHSGTLRFPYNINYKVTYAKSAEFAPNRGNAQIVKYESYENEYKTELTDKITGLKHVITPVEGVPYYYGDASLRDILDNNAPLKKGNYFFFTIKAPKEYRGNISLYNGQFVYENSLRQAGAKLIDNTWNDDSITVAFPVAAGSKEKSFDIRWEDDYTENFKVVLSAAMLEEDFTQAVAPKSLAFNGISSKMAVGDTQQLDVKVTKSYVRDTIALNYKVDDSSILNIDADTGYVTAVKKGVATVTVYPVFRDEEGNMKPIAGAKTATAKITVVDVTAPKIKSVTTIEGRATVKFAYPNNGYRLEYYVLKGKNVKADTFETKIAAMKNNAWKDIFAIAPSYGGETLNAKKTEATKVLRGLELNTDYTVYVRNVSGIRELDNGSVVELSAAGAVKGFTTGKAAVKNLYISFDRKYWNNNNERYEVALTEKTISSTTFGVYSEKIENPAADLNDEVTKSLPLSAEDLKYYQAPKLVYFVGSGLEKHEDSDTTEEQVNEWKQQGYKNFGAAYYYPSSIASIDNKGKLKLKGVGTAYLYVYDTVTGCLGRSEIHITAKADSVSGKSGKAKVGQNIYIKNLLDYKQGNTKLPNYNYTDGRIYVEPVDNDNYSIIQSPATVVISGQNVPVAYIFIAKKPGTYTIPVKDLNLEKAGASANTTVTIKVSGIDPVKNLKVSEVSDVDGCLTFNYSYDAYLGNPFVEGVYFVVDLKDARGRLIRSEELRDSENMMIPSLANESSSVFMYRMNDLTRLSNYTVSVTAVYQGEKSKPVSKKFKTTNIPASYRNLNKNQFGGCDISVETLTRGHDYYSLSDYPYFTTGNTYTLAINPDNYIAIERLTDTLTWRSTNTKVATVKANNGSYTATLKAVKNGETTIEVVSKVTKKVIARYKVYVKAVCEALDFFGDYDHNFVFWDPAYTAGVEVLTVNNPVDLTKLSSRDYRWVSFTAQADGRYSFTNAYQFYDSEGKGINFNNPDYLGKGQKVYFKLQGGNKSSVSYEKILSVNLGTDSINPSNMISFTAPRDDFYIFEASDERTISGNYWKENLSGSSNSLQNDNGMQGIGLKEGELVYVKFIAPYNYTVSVKTRDYTELSSAASEVTLDKEAPAKWFKFTAPSDGKYVLKSADATKNLTTNYYTDIANIYYYQGLTQKVNDFEEELTLKKGQTIALKVSAAIEADDEKVTAKINIISKDAVKATLNETAKLTIAKESSGEWFSFEAQEDGLYSFETDAVESADGPSSKAVGDPVSVSVEYYKNGMEYSNRVYGMPIQLEKGDVIYVSVSSYDTEKSIDVSLSVSEVKAAVLSAGVPADITLKDDSEFWYSFTAPSYGLYNFGTVVKENTEGSSHSAYVYRYSKVNDDYIGSFSNDQKVVLKAGETVTLKVSSNNVGDKKVTTSAKITVTKVEIIDATSEISMDMAKDAEKIYCVTFDKAGSYRFGLEKTEGDANIIRYSSLESIANNDYSSVSDGDSISISKNQKLYISVKASAEAAFKGKLTIKMPSIIEITDNKASAEIKGGERKVFSYTAKKDGRYFATRDASTNDGHSWGAALGIRYSRDNKYYSPIDVQGFLLHTGETIYFELHNTLAQSFNATVAISTAKDITVDTATTEKVIYDGLEQWYNFTVPEDGRYMYVAGADIQVDVYENMKYTTVPFDGMYLKKGEMYQIHTYTDVYTEEVEEKTTNLKISKVVAEAITETPTETTFDKANDKKWFTFTAPEEGIYEVGCDGDSVRYRIFKNLDKDFDGEGILNATIACKKGDVVVLELTVFADDTKAKLSIARRDVSELKLGENEITAKKDELKYYDFKAYTKGVYVIKTTEVPDGVKVGKNTSIPSSENIHDTRFINAGGKFGVFSIATDSETEIKIKLVVEKVLPTQNNLEVGKDKELTIPANGYVWAQFKAPEDGKYRLVSDSETAVLALTKVTESNSIDYSLDGPTSVNSESYTYMSKDDVVIYRISYTSSAEAEKKSATVKLKVEEQAITKLNEGKNSVAGKAGEFTACKFIPEKTGVFEIVVEDEDGGNIKYYGNNPNITINSNIDNITLMSATKDVFWLDLKINTDEAREITINYLGSYKLENKLLNIPAGESDRTEFVAPYSGTFVFYTTSEEGGDTTDSYGYLYDADNNEITHDDDSGEGNNYQITYYLEKGTKVYIETKAYAYEPPRSIVCRLHIELQQ